MQLTKNNILQVKERLNRIADKLKFGSLQRELLEIVISREICSCCDESYEHIDSIQVWSKTKVKDIFDPWAMTGEVRSKGMLEFHSDLPIRRIERTRFVPACAKCVMLLLETRLWKG